MKTAKVPPSEPSSSSRRAQPVRQTRTNPPRTNSGSNRLAPRESLSGANAVDQPIDIFPGVTHFADAITALPKELVRHFTLLKEVDAKIFAPQETLFQLVQAALESPPPEPARPANDVSSTIAPASDPMSAHDSSSGIFANGIAVPPASTNGSTATSVYDDSNLARRHLFRQTALKIQEMLVSLEEKNHVISTANDALQKQVNRIENIWPHLEGEFSEEAKWGSDSHWAYPENRAVRALNSQAEKTRREGAANLSAAAQFVAEEAAAARSEARKQAVAAKKSQRNNHTHDSEHDDHDGKGKGESSKKTQSHSKRKNAANAANAESPATVGLGIIGQTPASSTPAPKRRKIEKPTNGGTPTERAIASVYANGKNSKGKASESPRATPAPEQPAPKKRKALPNSTGQSKKRGGPGQTPSTTSSPVIGALPDNSKQTRASPAPSVSGRPQSARARQGSLASNADNPRQRPPSAAANKPNGSVPTPIETPTQNNGSRPTNETPKTQMEPPSATAKIEPVRQQSERAPTPQSAGGQKKESSAKPADEAEVRKEPIPLVATPIATQPVTTTKSGRASKPSTPAIGSFPENPTANSTNNNNNNNNPRSRPSRNSETPVVPKRSHKKGASAAHAVAVQKALAQNKADDETASIHEDENDGIDPNEETYCYCNQVSYGQMVGCDGEDCKREWFHLGCVGLKVAPGKNVKWYCDDCKKQMTAPGKKVNGR